MNSDTPLWTRGPRASPNQASAKDSVAPRLRKMRPRREATGPTTGGPPIKTKMSMSPEAAPARAGKPMEAPGLQVPVGVRMKGHRGVPVRTTITVAADRGVAPGLAAGRRDHPEPPRVKGVGHRRRHVRVASVRMSLPWGAPARGNRRRDPRSRPKWTVERLLRSWSTNGSVGASLRRCLTTIPGSTFAAKIHREPCASSRSRARLSSGGSRGSRSRAANTLRPSVAERTSGSTWLTGRSRSRRYMRSRIP